jgi:hypothetical protein
MESGNIDKIDIIDIFSLANMSSMGNPRRIDERIGVVLRVPRPFTGDPFVLDAFEAPQRQETEAAY